jgi:hypothetical protein
MSAHDSKRTLDQQTQLALGGEVLVVGRVLLEGGKLIECGKHGAGPSVELA